MSVYGNFMMGKIREDDNMFKNSHGKRLVVLGVSQFKRHSTTMSSVVAGATATHEAKPLGNSPCDHDGCDEGIMLG